MILCVNIYSEEEFVDSGEESDLENDDEVAFQENLLYPSARLQRPVEPASGLPSTVEILTADDGCRVYLVGTAHFSESSQEDVAKVIHFAFFHYMKRSSSSFILLLLKASSLCSYFSMHVANPLNLSHFINC